MKQQIEKWYRMGLWNSHQVRQAVEKGLLTEDEYRQITGKE